MPWAEFNFVGNCRTQTLGKAKGGQFKILQRAVFIWHIAGLSLCLLELSLDHACRWTISIAWIFSLKNKDLRQKKHFPLHKERNIPYVALHYYYTRYSLVLSYYCEGEGDVLSSGHNIKNILVHCQWIFAILNFPRIKAF